MPRTATKNRVRKHRIRDLVPANDLPPASQVQRFITFYVNHRDLKLAACQASLTPEMGERLYREEKVRTRIDKKILLIDVEEARLRARANQLTVDRLDCTVLELLTPKHPGLVRKQAAELGYKRIGLIRDGEFVGISKAGSSVGGAKTYGQLTTTTLRRTTTEEVVHATETKEEVPIPIAILRGEIMQDVQDY